MPAPAPDARAENTATAFRLREYVRILGVSPVLSEGAAICLFGKVETAEQILKACVRAEVVPVPEDREALKR